MPIRRVQGKMRKTKAIQTHPLLRKHIPASQWLNAKSLREMLQQHPVVFVKPDTGSGGKGIIRIRRLPDQRFQICTSRNCKNVKFHELLPAIRKQMRSSPYMIQQGVHLARYNGQAIDFRIIMQKPRNRWQISGKVVRVAAPGRFLTNYHQGGRAAPVERVLQRVLTRKSEASRIDQQLNILSHTTAEVLDRHFPGIRVLGLDIALDRSKRLWILEANTNPGTMLFKQLPDKSMLRRIQRNRQYMYRVY
ncbi:YheC/YheD family protein [Kroppenstedtia eburnea]|uniref:YheC/D like ATP-grasp n=1 Tax=Kroppenstedtia eburnea TaxID=714067 RepID=A0A1N7MJI7_9BACL|nr:YheC/YheD family protein [Kroppenstedtia eburnea]QKI81615.1 YheC/YheD family protein [Kroppenstedtia eburnea]SIS86316.1 YheC/D like ATP-grasp [Kroppenstedtia eburnea]